MDKNPYNIKDDEQFKHVINLLNELPRVKADDNFEYNLQVKIQNKNFHLNYPEKESFPFWKILVPVGTFAAAAMVFFIFIFNSPAENFENPFQIVPKLRSEAMGNFMESRNYADRKINNNDVIIKKEIPLNSALLSSATASLAQNAVKQQNNLNKSKNAAFPFNDTRSIDLDQINSSSQNLTNMDSRATLTSQRPQFSPFPGFFIREELDKKYVEALKARLDSLKMQMNNQNLR